MPKLIVLNLGEEPVKPEQFPFPFCYDYVVPISKGSISLDFQNILELASQAVEEMTAPGDDTLVLKGPEVLCSLAVSMALARDPECVNVAQLDPKTGKYAVYRLCVSCPLLIRALPGYR